MSRYAESVEIIRNDTIPTTWSVEALDTDRDGGVDVTIFSGRDAEERAKAYADWQYPDNIAVIS